MTYCLGIKTMYGLVAISDTRIVSGNETTTSKKVYLHQRPNHSMFIMTSGLRSVRDKAITYFKEAIEEKDEGFNKLYKAVNAFAKQVRQVADEDQEALKEAGLSFNLSAIVGGQLEEDEEHKLFLLYPQGNWVEVGQSSPFFIIGNSGYGKPILNRTISYDSTLDFALKTGFLSFDATRMSANDVDFPLDVLLYEKDTFQIVEHRFEEEDLKSLSTYWNNSIKNLIDDLHDDWMKPVLSKLPASNNARVGVTAETKFD